MRVPSIIDDRRRSRSLARYYADLAASGVKSASADVRVCAAIMALCGFAYVCGGGIYIEFMGIDITVRR